MKMATVQSRQRRRGEKQVQTYSKNTEENNIRLKKTFQYHRP